VPIWKISSPPCRWCGEIAPSPVFCMQPGDRGSAVQCLDGMAGQRSEAHAGDVDDGVGAEGEPAPSGPPSTLAQGSHACWCGWPGVGAVAGNVRWCTNHVAAGVLEVVVGAEAEVVVLQLGGRVDPSALVAAERPLLVVAGDDVLPQLRDRWSPASTGRGRPPGSSAGSHACAAGGREYPLPRWRPGVRQVRACASSSPQVCTGRTTPQPRRTPIDLGNAIRSGE
jgi:hypothetical protein